MVKVDGNAFWKKPIATITPVKESPVKNLKK